MTIKEGFGGKDTDIKIYSRENGGAEVWIVQNGLADESNPNRGSETLAYATLQEIIELRNECNAAIKSMAGV